ncbi:unnamed protein product [Sordaria macrospora k-hell]|uniref:WGS project CABT00000000 data, contig 2.14 n=1 Tax=Sordaria macrospora (strain ATCC MYA-333 / DSM 997 / K(L3346) / K-hell) TaxID=771870 RepID=F7VZ77_SORMK|nr:uncharacterized protein SMAC_07841 [Sordaria macrospora k-hell]KAH7633828.1 hypothetical protein B0T09DRAFT_355718 [Sordaria sp. MPI-SDFR-AT-0083]CCC10824.1 unnamed protein product [Sordaria macrospora k-hell]
MSDKKTGITVFSGGRLVRLIPNPSNDQEKAALKALFEYRLPGDPSKARIEWLDIVEARHLLWAYISSPKRELIRSILNTLNLEIVKRARPTSTFNFAEASIGNMFLTGARIFSGSFESAIYLLSMICSIPPNVNVLPAINSNFTHHISAGLEDGTTIAGQVAISHPSAPTALPDDVKISLATPSFPPLLHGGHGHGAPSFSSAATLHPAAMAMAIHNGHPPPQHLTVRSSITTSTVSTAPSSVPTTSSSVATTPTKSSFPRPGIRARSQTETEDASLPGSLPSLRTQNISFSKSDSDEADQLSARIERVWYINPYGHEIWPNANPKVIDALAVTKMVVYSIGSLWTSIVPSLVLRGVGEAIAGDVDADIEGEDQEGDGEVNGKVKKVLVLNATIDRETGPKSKPMTATDFVRAVAKAGEQSRRSDPHYHYRAEENESTDADGGDSEEEREGRLLRKYVTHLVYLDGQEVGGRLARTGTAPKVDVKELERLGIRCVRVEGRMQEDGKGVRYDEGGLGDALEGIIDE